jgi:uncharacterized membrane protein YdfJ with MMPL/SSD domain
VIKVVDTDWGLLLDTILVPPLMPPSLAAIVGRCVWWSLIVQSPPARTTTSPVAGLSTGASV